MAKLNRETKLYIIRSLASFNTPKETVEAVQQELGVKITPQQCEVYDPTKISGKNLSQELKDYFHEARKIFNENIQSIPVANLVYRLQKIQHVINSNSKNSILTLQALEQAAKEVGGVFTNQSKRVIAGPDGKPVEVSFAMTESEADKRIAELTAKLKLAD